MEHFYIITNKPKDEQLQVTKEVVAFLEGHGKKCSVCVRDKDAEEYRKGRGNCAEGHRLYSCFRGRRNPFTGRGGYHGRGYSPAWH